jgi:transposase
MCGSNTPAVIASSTRWPARSTSPMPAQPFPGSIASARTVATILTAKYADGKPLYRMESVLERSDVEIGRGTMGRWVIRSCEDWLSRPYEAMRQPLLRQDVIQWR